jgi:hypothetical protein
MRPKFEARGGSRVLQNRPNTIVHFEVIFDRCQVRYMYKRKSVQGVTEKSALILTSNRTHLLELF